MASSWSLSSSNVSWYSSFAAISSSSALESRRCLARWIRSGIPASGRARGAFASRSYRPLREVRGPPKQVGCERGERLAVELGAADDPCQLRTLAVRGTALVGRPVQAVPRLRNRGLDELGPGSDRPHYLLDLGQVVEGVGHARTVAVPGGQKTDNAVASRPLAGP